MEARVGLCDPGGSFQLRIFFDSMTTKTTGPPVNGEQGHECSGSLAEAFSSSRGLNTTYLLLIVTAL